MKHSSPLCFPSIFCLAILSGCHSYMLREVSSTATSLSVAMEATEPEFLMVRVENASDKPMHVNWSKASFMWPNGFESPVQVMPSDPLSVIYPSGKVEYFLQPVHHYLPPERTWSRRTSLDGSLTPDGLYDQYASCYRIVLRIPLCLGDDTDCFCQCNAQGDGPSWRVETVEATISRSRP